MFRTEDSHDYHMFYKTFNISQKHVSLYLLDPETELRCHKEVEIRDLFVECRVCKSKYRVLLLRPAI